MTNSISTLSQQMTMINRVKDMQIGMSRYQQQIATGTKYQTFKEYGPDADRIQRYRAELVETDGYLYNIDIAQTNIEQMDNAVSETIAQAQNVLSAINLQMSKGEGFDMNVVKQAADQALDLIGGNMNVRVGDRYLFAGSDVSVPPYGAPDVATSNLQQRVTDWLGGTLTTDNFLASVDGLTDSQLGYSTSVQSSKVVLARIDDNYEVDYTLRANDEGFKKIVASLNAIANMSMPGTGDIPTKDEFYDAVDNLYASIQEGIGDLRDGSSNLSSANQVMESVKQNHLDDKQNLQRILEDTEAADMTDAVIRFQTLQNQLEASYRITSILSELSLARMLT